MDSDSALVARARAGDKTAFGLLLSRHEPLLQGVCRRYLGQHADLEDIVQEAALQALLNLTALRRPERFGPWLAGIGLNLCRRRQHLQHTNPWSWEALQGGMSYPEPRDPGAGPLEIVTTAELQSRVLDAVKALPPGQRDAVLLFYLSGLTYAETAALLGTPVGAVKTRLHKARASLRQQLWQVWQEERMTSESATPYRHMRIADVRTRPAAEAANKLYAGPYVVVLEEVEGGRLLPIWVGPQEGVSLAMLLEQLETSRPMTPAFMAAVLAAAGARLEQVRITRLESDTYYAEALIAGPSGTGTVDARPSDAMMLALAAGTPIYVDESVLARVEKNFPDMRAAWEQQSSEHLNASAIVAEVQATMARQHAKLMEQKQRSEQVGPA